MGVRRLFPSGGQNFPVGAGGGGKNILFALKMFKNILFSFKKKSKNILFCAAKGGQVPPLALPCGRPWMS